MCTRERKKSLPKEFVESKDRDEKVICFYERLNARIAAIKLATHISHMAWLLACKFLHRAKRASMFYVYVVCIYMACCVQFVHPAEPAMPPIACFAFISIHHVIRFFDYAYRQALNSHNRCCDILFLLFSALYSDWFAMNFGWQLLVCEKSTNSIHC